MVEFQDVVGLIALVVTVSGMTLLLFTFGAPLDTSIAVFEAREPHLKLLCLPSVSPRF